jgi:hypothetical protein
MAKFIGKSMRCTSKSMELASFVVGLDIVELWTKDPNGNFHCTYVHATEQTLSEHKDMIVGHYPNHKNVHILSPRVSLHHLTNCLYCENIATKPDSFPLSVSNAALQPSTGVKEAVLLEGTNSNI